MSRIETIGDATLYLGDCREILPTLTGINIVASDPPYGIEDLVGGYTRDGATILNDRNLGCCMEALAASAKVAPDAVWAIFYSPRVRRPFFQQLPPELHDLGEIIWDKKMPGMGRQIRYQHENIALLYTGHPKQLLTPTANFSIIQHIRDGEQHPHQKPKGLMRRLLEMMDGDVVLDPFMGSGSTGVATVDLRRRFIGIEADPAYFDIAVSRITAASNQPDMFTAIERRAEEIQITLSSLLDEPSFKQAAE